MATTAQIQQLSILVSGGEPSSHFHLLIL